METQPSKPPYWKIKREILALTPDVAWTHKNRTSSPTERELDPKRVKHYAAKNERGLLHDFHWDLAIVDGETELYRMNGWSTSTMLCGLNGSFPKGLEVILTTYGVRDYEGLAELFRQFDDRVGARSPADVSGAYQNLYPELRQIDRRTAKFGIEGVVWHAKTVLMTPAVPAGDDRYSWFNQKAAWPFLQWLPDVLEETTDLWKHPVLAAMYSTWGRNPGQTKEFFDKVSNGGDQYNAAAPDAALASWLKKANTSELQGGMKVKPPELLYIGVIHCWNAYRTGHEVAKVRTDHPKGVRIPVEP